MASKMSTEKILQNQRIAIWLIVAFVVFITLWFVYSVKTLQTTSMTTSSEASSIYAPGRSCTPSDYSRYKVKGRISTGVQVTRQRVYCCKSTYNTRYYWTTVQCP